MTEVNQAKTLASANAAAAATPPVSTVWMYLRR